ncbi:hypothetical protein HPB50_007091 [Hyalomma asiaticum]|uniref:Uncharacterized protein n=1 Tax=Hyalomma asiaticum TaxID=266040 RepID=A0ACB7SPB8_HYAAI|nr:hypothetical protein HPB50_007091 [Hyalomma asiaticum]
MRECKRSLVKRWERQRLNRKLRLKIAEVSERANEYAHKLETESWVQFCDSMRDTSSTAKTWAILRSLLDPGSTKTTVCRTIRKLVSDFTVGAAVDLPCTTEYEVLANADLDAPITRAELFAAAQTAKRNTAKAPDRVTNAMLRNLSDDCLDELIQYFNEYIWEPGILPPEWKEASLVLIPKHGKRPSLENLRPISLTSRLGKLFEKVIQTRLVHYLEDRGFFPTHMYGFRYNLSTQDVSLRLRDEVLRDVP